MYNLFALTSLGMIEIVNAAHTMKCAYLRVGFESWREWIPLFECLFYIVFFFQRRMERPRMWI